MNKKIENFDLDPETGLFICPVCNKQFVKKGISSHVWRHHEGKNFAPIPKNSENRKPIWNKGKTKADHPGLKKASDSMIEKFKNGEMKVWSEGQPLPEATKNKISEARKKYLKEYPDSFHWTKNDKFISIPCEHFKKKLKENGIEFVEEFRPLEDRFFRIDVCFPEHKLGIEINGSQHYESGGKKLRPYYQSRHDLLSQAGWRILEVYHSNVWKDNEVNQIIEIIIKTLNNVELTHYKDFPKQISKAEMRRIELQARKEAGYDPKAHRRLEYNPEKLEKYRRALFNAGPNTYGWISRASKELKISHSQIRRVINKHFPEFN